MRIEKPFANQHHVPKNVKRVGVQLVKPFIVRTTKFPAYWRQVKPGLLFSGSPKKLSMEAAMEQSVDPLLPRSSAHTSFLPGNGKFTSSSPNIFALVAYHFQGFISSIETCIPSGGLNIPFKSKTDLSF